MRRKTEIKADFLWGNTEMTHRIRRFDWTKTSLGHPDDWSHSLKSVIGLMLANSFPMLLWWGEDYIQIYNDPYIPVPGMKHPQRSLGVPAYECWSEIWHILKPLIDKPFGGGPATWMTDITLIINRNNFSEETHFTIGYSPVPDDTAGSGIGGVLATVVEITETVIGKRQMETLRDLGKNLSAVLPEDEVYSGTLEVLANNPYDIPSASIYRIRECEAIGAPAAMQQNILVSAEQRKIVIFPTSPDLEPLAKGAWDVTPAFYACIPLRSSSSRMPVAVLVAGMNPHRKFDDSYHNFFQLVADQVSLALSNAFAYEEERKRAKALEELDKSKTIFFSNISHEFRTPLTLMLGTIEELLKESALGGIAQERLQIAHRNALRLLKLVNTLLDFSRIESGRQKASFEPTDIAALTRNLAGNFRSVIEKAGLDFSVETGVQGEAGVRGEVGVRGEAGVRGDVGVRGEAGVRGEPRAYEESGVSREAGRHIETGKPEVPVYVDRDMWEKIVFNLLSNAFKYTLKGSIAVRLFFRDGRVVLEVSDTGTGIPENELPHMFDRFHRVENSKGRTIEGTGIGLSLTKELVHLLGGDIGIRSIEDEGTIVTVTLPTGKDHLPPGQIAGSGRPWEEPHSGTLIDEATALLEAPLHKASDEGGDEGKDTVLVVDDNPDMSHHICSVLRKYYHAVTASNGKEALERIAVSQPDLVLTDIMMPEMDGITLLKALRQDRRTARLPVIFLTARAGEESRMEGFETGADDYLVKPFAANELLSRVRTQISIARKRAEVQRQIEESERRLEAEVARRTFELKQMNKELESFNYIASHDLQEPLRKIQTFILLLQQRRDDSAAWDKYAAKINESSERMSQLIQSVLEYSRLSQLSESVKDTDLNAVLENVRTDYELIIRETGARITSDHLPVVEAIPFQMHQLFSNLISNAIKFGGKQPAIRISSAIVTGNKIKLRPGGSPEQQFAEIRFADNGIGFEQQYGERIFKLFQRLHPKSAYSGTGVGLSIVSKIVKNHMGYILAESEKGKGAVFTLWLPLTFEGGVDGWQAET